MRRITILACAFAVTACLGVRQEDLDAWVGQPVALLDQHPIFLTMRLERSVTADGIEVRNYVNGVSATQCGGFGAGDAAFLNCVHRNGACNNIFYIKGGVVLQYMPVGSGGAGCYTDATAQSRPAIR